MAATSVFIVKESKGTYALNGPPDFQPWEALKKDLEEARFTSVSPNGNLVAVGNNSMVNVFDAREGSLKCSIRNRMLSATFSPNGSYLLEWNNPSQNHDNFQIWSVKNGKDVKVVHSLKLSKPPEVQFSTDEEIFARLTNGSIIFSKAPDFQGTDRKTPDSLKIAKFSLSTSPNTPTAGPLFVICYIPATTSGQPSFARMFRYPNFETVIASKSFFQADRVEFKWNKKGTAVLVITSTDIDKSGQSYYGKTMLHYMDTKGETAVIQTEADSAIVHAAEWSPTSMEFAIITGKMPQTRAVLMNTKCEVIIDMGVSARNAIYFNPQGNILLLGGFGNLGHGRIEMWEVKKHKKMIAMATASNTTQLEWLNDGVHFITAVTAPRMQVGNEFHVWNFKGIEIHKWAPEKHLFGIVPLRNEPPLPFPESLLDDFVKSQGNRPLAAKIEQQKKASVYVPPSKRGIVGGSAAGATKSQSGAKGSATAPGQSQLSENEKKIRTLKKKLEQIDKIKEMIKEGKPVEKNQEEKLKTEKEILEQIKALEI